MSYYHLPTGTERSPRTGERRIDNGAWVTPLNGAWTDTDLIACGYYLIVETESPTVSANQVAEQSVEFDGTTATRTWTVRTKTKAEIVPDHRAELLAVVENAKTLPELRAAIVTAIKKGIL